MELRTFIPASTLAPKFRFKFGIYTGWQKIVSISFLRKCIAQFLLLSYRKCSTQIFESNFKKREKVSNFCSYWFIGINKKIYYILLYSKN